MFGISEKEAIWILKKLRKLFSFGIKNMAPPDAFPFLGTLTLVFARSLKKHRKSGCYLFLVFFDFYFWFLISFSFQADAFLLFDLVSIFVSFLWDVDVLWLRRYCFFWYVIIYVRFPVILFFWFFYVSLKKGF